MCKWALRHLPYTCTLNLNQPQPKPHPTPTSAPAPTPTPTPDPAWTPAQTPSPHPKPNTITISIPNTLTHPHTHPNHQPLTHTHTQPQTLEYKFLKRNFEKIFQLFFSYFHPLPLPRNNKDMAVQSSEKLDLEFCMLFESAQMRTSLFTPTLTLTLTF